MRLLDGGLASELEASGCDLAHDLWSARALLETPEAVARAHARFLEAGAECITAATYQASFEGFRRHGLSDEAAERAFEDAVRIAVRERDRFVRERRSARRPLVAASIGPYGAFLADGSEYGEDYDVDDAELVRFHKRRLALLARSGADLLAIETIPSRREARLLAALHARLPDAPPAWISFTCRDESRISDGNRAEDAARDIAPWPGILAVGVNCTAPVHIAPLIPKFWRGSRKPVIVYPNAGGVWDPTRKVWERPAAAADLPALSRSWKRLGAAMIGGCCRVGPDEVRAIGRALEPLSEMTIRIGDLAPDFTARTTHGAIRFHEWIGDGWAILFSHPKDFTPVCTTELGRMAGLLPEFRKRNCRILGLSVDPVADHERWKADIEETQGHPVEYPLIGDDDLAVARLYDMIHPNAVGGGKRTAADNMTVRSVFVVGPDKRVRLILTYPMTTGRNFDEILRALDSMQLTEAHRVATPANWRDGDDVIIVPAVSDEEAREAYPDGWKAVRPYLRLVPQPKRPSGS